MRLREEASSIAVGSSSDHHGSRNQAVSCTHHTSRLRMMGGHTAQTTMLRQPSAALLQCEHKHGGPYSSESFSGRGSALRVLADNASVGEPMSGSPDVTPSRQKNNITHAHLSIDQRRVGHSQQAMTHHLVFSGARRRASTDLTVQARWLLPTHQASFGLCKHHQQHQHQKYGYMRRTNGRQKSVYAFDLTFNLLFASGPRSFKIAVQCFRILSAIGKPDLKFDLTEAC